MHQAFLVLREVFGDNALHLLEFPAVLHLQRLSMFCGLRRHRGDQVLHITQFLPQSRGEVVTNPLQGGVGKLLLQVGCIFNLLELLNGEAVVVVDFD